jgi:hypothetical protein
VARSFADKKAPDRHSKFDDGQRQAIARMIESGLARSRRSRVSAAPVPRAGQIAKE